MFNRVTPAALAALLTLGVLQLLSGRYLAAAAVAVVTTVLAAVDWSWWRRQFSQERDAS